jgi:hypothetical protein
MFGWGCWTLFLIQIGIFIYSGVMQLVTWVFNRLVPVRETNEPTAGRYRSRRGYGDDDGILRSPSSKPRSILEEWEDDDEPPQVNARKPVKKDATLKKPTFANFFVSAYINLVVATPMAWALTLVLGPLPTYHEGWSMLLLIYAVVMTPIQSLVIKGIWGLGYFRVLCICFCAHLLLIGLFSLVDLRPNALIDRLMYEYDY